MLTSPDVRDYSAPLWALLMFEAFLRCVTGQQSRTGQLLAAV